MTSMPMNSCQKLKALNFSGLKIVKNYLRSTMRQDRLTSLSVLSIEYDTASVLVVKKQLGGLKILQITKVQEHRSKLNFNVVNMKQLTN